MGFRRRTTTWSMPSVSPATTTRAAPDAIDSGEPQAGEQGVERREVQTRRGVRGGWARPRAGDHRGGRPRAARRARPDGRRRVGWRGPPPAVPAVPAVPVAPGRPEGSAARSQRSSCATMPRRMSAARSHGRSLGQTKASSGGSAARSCASAGARPSGSRAIASRVRRSRGSTRTVGPPASRRALAPARQEPRARSTRTSGSRPTVRWTPASSQRLQRN